MLDQLNRNWHHLAAPEVMKLLQTSTDGLTSEDARRRLAEHGPNELERRKKESLVSLFLRQFKSPLIYILLFAAAVSLAIGKPDHTVVIMIVLLFNAIMGFIQEARARRSMEALLDLSAPRARALRDKKQTETPTRDLAPGDVIILEAGSKVPADARLIEVVRLQADESALTGESQPVYKSLEPLPEKTILADRLNMVFAGTVITSGRARAVVTATGMRTEIGGIARAMHETVEQQTPIQKKMVGFGRFIILIVSVQVTLAFLIGYFMRGMNFYDIFLVAVSQMVSSIPEGLPIAVTVALAVGMQRMARRNVFIRKLPAVEVLGSATVICSDKTGTLTRNEMTSRRAATLETEADIAGVGYNLNGGLEREGRHLNLSDEPEIERLLRLSALCNNAEIGAPSADGKTEVTGDPTEIAYLVAAAKCGLSLDRLRGEFPRSHELPFDSDLQLMATRHRPEGGRTLVAVKGAPEKVLALCVRCWLGGSERPMTEDLKRQAGLVAERMAGDALRVLAFAYLEEQGRGPDTLEVEHFKGRLLFAGFIGNMDPPRPEARDAIAACRRAGVRTVMITGDHLITAAAIARELGICPQGESGFGGHDLDAMDDARLVEIARITNVFGRIEPRHKLRIVKAFQSMGHVVAMTGDGINDAPALTAADIGVAMGLTGTDVAKEAGSMVIADDNFATIVNGIEEGRGITANMRKTIRYLLCSSNTEILILLTTLFIGWPLPLLPLMILWINLVTDGAMTVPLIMEPRENVMDRLPEKKDLPIVNPTMLKLLLFQAPIMAASVLGLFHLARRGFLDPAFGGAEELAYARTVAFTALAITQWFNGLNARSIWRSTFSRSFFGNRFVLSGLALGLLAQLLVVYAPFMERFFGTVPLSMGDWLKILAASSVILWADEVRKLIYRFLSARQKNQGHLNGNCAH